MLPVCHRVVEQLGGKQLVMTHLSHEDPNVRYEALLAVQKLMVHNWYVMLLLHIGYIISSYHHIIIIFYGTTPPVLSGTSHNVQC